MNAEQLFCELELRWVRLLRKSCNPRLRQCAAYAARRESELLGILERTSSTALRTETPPRRKSHHASPGGGTPQKLNPPADGPRGPRALSGGFLLLLVVTLSVQAAHAATSAPGISL
ncbi:hypothetical protein OH491_22530 [Termitidicoccus mucosus]|uniref:Uncharacterized protein n=1 Tax=Termitidicoccus mucosus TaxID=1184151 RepID=A0A178IN13_9BACT|nr:hypothetical protein AW736_03950 [Opitutaceae bacterium TSB47]